MLLQELQIEGFRSLKSVTWKPGNLNVLIGPNGGGKSNLLRALDLLRIAAAGGLREAIIGTGGMAPLVWDGQAKRMQFSLQLSDGAQSNYVLSLERVGSTGSYEIDAERMCVSSNSVHVDVIERSSLSGVPGKTNVGEMMQRSLVPSSEALLSVISGLSYPLGLATRQFIRDCSIHGDLRVDQDADLRRAIVTRSEKRVNPDGQNLIAVLHTLYTGDRNFEEFLDKAMSAAFPDDYDKLIFPPAEHGRTEMRVRRKHRKGTDSPADLSDGTLRFLLLVTILGSTDPAPLIAIDEPEAGLHPRMMSIIAEVAANAAIKSQVIFTTHSPQFLDAFGDELPVVTVVTSNGSETELKNIEGEELRRWVADYSLGKFAFSGEAEIAS